MNLKNPGKKLYFKIIIGTIIGAGIALWIFMMYECKNYIQDDFERERVATKEKYEAKIDSLNNTRKELIIKQTVLQERIDSLKSEKTKVIIKYDDKIKSIYSATAYEHAGWLDSTVEQSTKMDSLATQ